MAAVGEVGASGPNGLLAAAAAPAAVGLAAVVGAGATGLGVVEPFDLPSADLVSVGCSIASNPRLGWRCGAQISRCTKSGLSFASELI